MQALENDFCPGGTIICFFHAELTNWEMIILILCLCIWYRILYSNTIFGFFQKFPLIISAKGVGGQM